MMRRSAYGWAARPMRPGFGPSFGTRRRLIGLAPTDVAGVRSVWDAFTSAVYNGSNELTAILDTGPDGIDLAPDLVSVQGASVTVNGATVTLPGPFPVSNPTKMPEGVIPGEDVGDFTVMLAFPINATQTTTSTYFAFQSAADGPYPFQATASGTPGAMNIVGNGGLATIDVGFDNLASAGSHAILFATRSGAGLTLDAWYDKGAGVVKPTQVVASDPFGSPMAIDGVAVGGRGSITYTWPSSVYHMSAWFDRALTAGEKLGLAQRMGFRLGIDAIV